MKFPRYLAGEKRRYTIIFRGYALDTTDHYIQCSGLWKIIPERLQSLKRGSTQKTPVFATLNPFGGRKDLSAQIVDIIWRGKLFYRLVQQAVIADPVLGSDITGGQRRKTSSDIHDSPLH